MTIRTSKTLKNQWLHLNRRQAIRNMILTLGILKVPKTVRMETAEKFSKRWLGSAVAHAQSENGQAIIPVPQFHIGIRMGYSINWIVGLPSDAQLPSGADMSKFERRNVPWPADPEWITTHKEGPMLREIAFPKFANDLKPYVTGIQGSLFQSNQGHSPFFTTLHKRGLANIPVLAASQCPYETAVSNYFAFAAGVNQDECHPNLGPYVPSLINGWQSALKLFTQPDSVNNGIEITAHAYGRVIDFLARRFHRDIRSVLKTSQSKRVLEASMNQTQKLISQEYVDAFSLDEQHPQNMEALSILENGIQSAPGGTSQVAPESLYFILKAMSIAVTPPVGMISFQTGDWHGETAHQGSATNANVEGTRQYQTGAYFCKVIRNILEASRSLSHFPHPVFPGSLADNEFTVSVSSEFNRTHLISSNKQDNGDGGQQAVLVFNAKAGQSRFKAGMFNELLADGSMGQYKNGSIVPSENGRGYPNDLSFGHHAKLLNINVSNIDELSTAQKAGLTELLS